MAQYNNIKSVLDKIQSRGLFDNFLEIWGLLVSVLTGSTIAELSVKSYIETVFTVRKITVRNVT